MIWTPVLFLDIDGVLNRHEQHRNGYCGIDEVLALNLDRVAHGTDCTIVISSAWRYLVLNGQMKIDGFRSLMLTHGVPFRLTERVAGTIRKDASATNCDRGRQIAQWLHGSDYRLGQAVAVDDRDDGITAEGIALVQTDANIGLDEQAAERLLAALTAAAKSPGPYPRRCAARLAGNAGCTNLVELVGAERCPLHTATDRETCAGGLH